MTMGAQSQFWSVPGEAIGVAGPRSRIDTVSERLAVPSTVEQTSKVLAQAERVLRVSDGGSEVLRELARFLGASSSAWTRDHRVRLRKLLRRGDAIEAILDEVTATPRAEVVDEAVAILGELARARHHADRLGNLLAPASSCPDAVRVTVASALGRSDNGHAVSYLENALSDPSPDVRDAVVNGLVELRAGDLAAKLQARLTREPSALVRETIQTALDELASG